VRVLAEQEPQEWADAATAFAEFADLTGPRHHRAVFGEQPDRQRAVEVVLIRGRRRIGAPVQVARLVVLAWGHHRRQRQVQLLDTPEAALAAAGSGVAVDVDADLVAN
jgi:hypothetical protein